jgi:hypothetical protein
MPKENFRLTAEELPICKWQYELYGDFYKTLFKAILHADSQNIKRIARGFPAIVSGYLKYTRQTGWWERVSKKWEARFEVDRIYETPASKLPLLMGEIKTEVGLKCLESRMKGQSGRCPVSGIKCPDYKASCTQGKGWCWLK